MAGHRLVRVVAYDYSIDRTVDALRHVADRKVLGKVVIDVA